LPYAPSVRQNESDERADFAAVSKIDTQDTPGGGGVLGPGITVRKIPHDAGDRIAMRRFVSGRGSGSIGLNA